MRNVLQGSLICIVLLLSAQGVQAQELVLDTQTTSRAKVLDIVSQERRNIPGTNVESIFQTLRAEILQGKERSDIVTVENDYLELDVGQHFYVTHVVNELDGTDYYYVAEVDRLPTLLLLATLFIGAVLLFGG